MIPSVRYGLAFFVNVVLPTAAYRIAFPHIGLPGALLVSSVPLFVWIGIDLLRYRHFDALSALVLASIAMSVLIFASGAADALRAAREPLVSGIVGVLFLLSLLLRRPLVFYLARSTLSRERQGRESEFDAMWLSRPALARSIRLMTAVWGIGLVCENAARLGVVLSFDTDDAHRISTYVGYAVYAALTVWTIVYRHVVIKTQ
ncbi:VC0807 family protein [Paraburkholderia sp. SARCC-3016]|uniref:VC0807 family protein n=1 Tax=Paraburkholderia sp. SARCC-3016 TaxID=3058611 RepID=UPI002809CFF2|nr:VC0807 family protein [Paraburkholderia sp. SARCC-3016]MDQ7977776.1 VC0807 family protein [Paraburkholderia sp. SARCC-3016]